MDPSGNIDIRKWISDNILDPASNISAGFGDTISFGGTRWFREEITNCDGVDYGSGWYGGGGVAGDVYIGTVIGVATGGVASAVMSRVGATAAGQSFGRGVGAVSGRMNAAPCTASSAWRAIATPGRYSGERIGRFLPRLKGIYHFKTAGNQWYVGQSGHLLRRSVSHVLTGKLPIRNIRTLRFQLVQGGKTEREIAEHYKIFEFTRGVHPKFSDAVANMKDPIGGRLWLIR